MIGDGMTPPKRRRASATGRRAGKTGAALAASGVLTPERRTEIWLREDWKKVERAGVVLGARNVGLMMVCTLCEKPLVADTGPVQTTWECECAKREWVR